MDCLRDRHSKIMSRGSYRPGFPLEIAGMVGCMPVIGDWEMRELVKISLREKR